jgi:hypothetical protein
MFEQVLGIKERKVRSLFIKELTPDRCEKFGVDKMAVAQQFHHSSEIQDKCYKSGMRNTLNKLQAHILNWE